MAQKIRKGDSVVVMVGRDRGKHGRVLRVVPQRSRLMVEGVNMVVRHVRPRPGVTQAGRVSMEALIHSSNVQFVCPRCNKAVRVGFSTLDDGKKVRVCRKCREVVD